MATLVAKTITASPSPLTKPFHLSALLFLVGYVGPKPRWASSRVQTELELDSSTSKPGKKLADRLSAVVDAVNERKLPPELRGRRNAVRSETDIANVVEQRIWHSMEEGEFENLPGKGKPLNLVINPHADPAEDTLYRILSKNGCAPEWVELNKEIRNNIAEWRFALKKVHVNRLDGNESKWIEASETLKVQMRSINDKGIALLFSMHKTENKIRTEPIREQHRACKQKQRTQSEYFDFAGCCLIHRLEENKATEKSTLSFQVFRYNLIVPFGRQMFGLKWEKELDRLKE